MIDLQSTIEQHIPLTGSSSKKGWRQTLCKVCNDHGRKGLRGGFRFDGDIISYNCFNCGATGSYTCNSVYRMSKDMKNILLSFGIPEDTITQLDFESFQRKAGNDGRTISKVDRHKQELNLTPTPIDFPTFFKPLSSFDVDYKWRAIAEYHLIETRSIQPESYPFFLLDPSYVNDTFAKKWYGRLIIPIYDKQNRVIFWQGRDLTDTLPHKYLSPAANKNNIIFGLDRLTHSDEPLYIVEGIFDALHLNGIAVLGKTISPEQTAMIQQSSRKKVYVPDRHGDGYKAAEKAIEIGWNISTPDIGDCKDITEAVVRYGRMYVVRTLMENTVDGEVALMRIPLYCTDYYAKPKTKRTTRS